MKITSASSQKFCIFLMFLLAVEVFLISGCSNPVELPTASSTPIELTWTPVAPRQDILEMKTLTPEEPTVTSIPLAAMINGEGILMEDYLIERALFEKAVGTSLATSDEDVVIQDMIDEALLAQAASAAGYEVDEMLLEERIQELGLSSLELSAWKSEHGYSEEAYQRAMTRSIAAAWMRDRLVEDVSKKAEQVHARQILLYNLTEAESVYAQLETGIDFGILAEEYDPITKGDLGWFPRGYLTVSALDEIIFNLKPGDYSSIIESPIGFHIVQLIEYDSDAPLSINAYKVVQLQSLTQWLETQREVSEIILFLP